MFDELKEYKVSDHLLFTDNGLKGSEYGGEIEYDNGYGLSVVRHESSYGGKQGLFEVMLTRNGNPYSLPPITHEYDTVKGFLTKEQVNEILETVSDLPATV